MAAAITRSTFVSAAKGSVRAQRLSTDLIRAQETETKREADYGMEVAHNYKIAWTAELARRKKLRIIMPAPLPNPDHVVIDYAEKKVWIKGPVSEEEKKAWARWEYYREEFAADLRALEARQDALRCRDRKPLKKESQEAAVLIGNR